MLRKLLLPVLFIALLLSIAAQDDKSYSADRFDVDVAAQTDRSLLVEETVAFRFVGGPFSFVFRELPTDHTDGITDIVAGVDGVPWPEGTGPGQVEIEDGNPIIITWHLSPTSNVMQNFTLSYRALGVVRQGDGADVLDWQALPDEYEYDIASSTVTVSYPAMAIRQGEPEVTAGKADTTTVDGQAVFTQGNLSAGDPLVVRLNFAPGGFSNTLPTWQTQTQAQNSRAWIWITAAVATLVGGLIAVFAAARPYQRTIRKANSFLHKPPADLPPALAGWLFNQTVSWQHGLATLFDLAARGLITIEEAVEKKWYQSNQFAITLLNRSGNLRPHESALLDLLFTDKSGTPHDTITMSDMGQLITSSRWKKFTESLEGEAEAQGLVSRESKERGKRMMIWSGILMLMLVPLAVLLFVLWTTFGGWPLLLAGAIFIVGLIALLSGATLSPLSDRGAKLAEAFDPFRRFLDQAGKGKMDVPDPAYYEAYLPYATAFGYAQPWVKQQSKAGYDVAPSYFRGLSDDGGANMVVFIAAVTAASNSGGSASASAAGAAGAGAAGGGASGAG
mgnify:FL=1|jgi:hypothetical protein